MNDWSTNSVFDLRVEEDTGEEVEEYKQDLTLFSQHAAQQILLEAMVDLW